jgi:hypothetical protein
MNRPGSARVWRLALSVATVVAFAGSTLVPSSAAVATPGASVLGPSALAPHQIARWYESLGKRPRLAISIEEMARLYVEEGSDEGVRGDVAFAQSIVETGYFEFPPGQVKPSDNNFAGIGACDSCNGGLTYDSPREGVRAQIQLLRKYADPTARIASLHHPSLWSGYDSAFMRGVAPSWTEMGNGHWATSTTYASTVLGVYDDMLASAGYGSVCGRSCTSAAASAGQAASAVAIVAHPGGGYYALRLNGGVEAVNAPFFGAPALSGESARSIAAMPDGNGYLVLDGFGGVYLFGSAKILGALGSPDFTFDIARSIAVTADGRGFAVLDGYGGIHAFGDAPAVTRITFPGHDIAKSLVLTADNAGTYVLDGNGNVWTAGTAKYLGSPTFNLDIARTVVVTGDGAGYAVLDGYGGIHTFGNLRPPGSVDWAKVDRWRGLAFESGGYAVVGDDGHVVRV